MHRPVQNMADQASETAGPADFAVAQRCTANLKVEGLASVRADQTGYLCHRGFGR